MAKTHYIIPFFVPHEGCPHACIFCNQRSITGEKAAAEARGQAAEAGAVASEAAGKMSRAAVAGGQAARARDWAPGLPRPEDPSREVAGKIRAYLATIPQDPARPGHPAPGLRVEVAFYGGSFTGIPRDRQAAWLAPARAALAKGIIHGIRISTRPDYISPEILDFLQAFGVSAIELGVQSMDPVVLAKAHRGHTREDVLRAVAMIRGVQAFALGLQMMTGLPGDTPRKALATARELASLKPDFVRIYPTLVIKDTLLEELYQRGEYQPQDLEEAVALCAQLVKIFREAGIKVVRIGLQPTEEIREGAQIVAGPFHPAFRELVEGELWREKLAGAVETILRRNREPEEIVFALSPRDLSGALGQGKKNIRMLEERYGVKVRLVQEPGLPRGAIRPITPED